MTKKFEFLKKVLCQAIQSQRYLEAEKIFDLLKSSKFSMENPKFILLAGIEILGRSDRDFSLNYLRFLQEFKIRCPELRALVLEETVIYYCNYSRYLEAYEHLNSLLHSFPYSQYPLFSGYAGYLYWKMIQHSTISETIKKKRLKKAISHFKDYLATCNIHDVSIALFKCYACCAVESDCADELLVKVDELINAHSLCLGFKYLKCEIFTLEKADLCTNSEIIEAFESVIENCYSLGVCFQNCQLMEFLLDKIRFSGDPDNIFLGILLQIYTLNNDELGLLKIEIYKNCVK